MKKLLFAGAAIAILSLASCSNNGMVNRNQANDTIYNNDVPEETDTIQLYEEDTLNRGSDKYGNERTDPPKK